MYTHTHTPVTKSKSNTHSTGPTQTESPNQTQMKHKHKDPTHKHKNETRPKRYPHEVSGVPINKKRVLPRTRGPCPGGVKFYKFDLPPAAKTVDQVISNHVVVLQSGTWLLPYWREQAQITLPVAPRDQPRWGRQLVPRR